MRRLAPLLLLLLAASAVLADFSGSWSATGLPQPFVPTIQYSGCSNFSLTSFSLQVGPDSIIPQGKFGFTAGFSSQVVLAPGTTVPSDISVTAMGDVSFSGSTGSFSYSSISASQSPAWTQGFCSLTGALLINFEAAESAGYLFISSWAGQSYALSLSSNSADYYVDLMND